MVFAAQLAQELVVHPDAPVLEVQVFACQTAELTDAQACIQQHDKLVVVLGIGLVLPDEVHPGPELLLGQRDAALGVIRYHVGQLEDKWVLAYGVLVAGHLEGRLHNAADAGDGAVTLAVLVQLQEPQFGV